MVYLRLILLCLMPSAGVHNGWWRIGRSADASRQLRRLEYQLGASARSAARIQPNAGPHQGNAAGIERDKTASGFESQLAARI